PGCSATDRSRSTSSSIGRFSTTPGCAETSPGCRAGPRGRPTRASARGGPPVAEPVAVVTGAQGRIGHLVATGLHSRGYAVVGLDRPEAVGAGGGRGADRIPWTLLACDVAAEDQVRATFASIEAEHGRVD